MTYGLDIATFESPGEVRAVQKMCHKKSANLTEWIHVGGMTLIGGSKEWYWVTTGEKIDFKMAWLQGEPNFEYDSEHCLSIGTSKFLFNDIDCYNNHKTKFICQKVNQDVQLAKLINLTCLKIY